MSSRSAVVVGRCLFTVVTALLCGSSIQAQEVFPGRLFPTDGLPPVSATFGDLDADGVTDAALACPGFGGCTSGFAVGYMLGSGTGGFEGVLFLASIPNAKAIAIADVDNNGLADLVASGTPSGALTSAIAIAPAVFGGVITSTVSFGLIDEFPLMLADLNGDASPDALLRLASPPAAVVVHGNGLGGFGSTTSSLLPGGADVLTPPALVDLDVDGDIDLVAPGTNGTVFFLSNNGTGSFFAGPESGTGGAGSGIAAGDLNLDGRPDIVASTATGVSVLLGTGTGSLVLSVQSPLPAPPSPPAVGDVDADGIADVVVSVTDPAVSSLSLATFLGLGNGTLSTAKLTLASQYDLGNAPRPAVADLDDDPSAEVVLAAGASSAKALGVYHIAPAGAPIAATVSDSTLIVCDMLRATDLDGDNDVDGVVAQQGAGQFAGQLNDGSGQFTAGPVTSVFTHINSLDSGLVDGDAFADVVASTGGPLLLYRGNGVGGFAPALSFGSAVYSAALADLEPDGDLDACAMGAGAVKAFIGDGTGSLIEGVPVAPFATGLLIAADLNADGRADVVVQSQDFVRVALGDGSGSFLTPTLTFIGGNPTSRPAAADIDLDGDLDILVLHGSVQVTLLLGDGLGGLGAARSFWATPSPFDVAYQPKSLAVSDVNLDGRPDICIGGGSAVHVMLGAGFPGFEPVRAYAAGSSPVGVAIADFDGDSRDDVAAAMSGGIAMLKNKWPGPLGVSSYGIGTPGCSGLQALAAKTSPAIGNKSFRLSCSNAPPLLPGMLIVGAVPDVVGLDPLGLGIKCHVDVLALSGYFLLPIPASPSGTGAIDLPIPKSVALIGSKFYTQAIWPWLLGPCTPSLPLSLSSSNGVELTIQF